MKELQGLLEKYFKIKPTDGIIKEAIIEALKNVSGIVITKEKISISRANVFLNLSPSYRVKVLQRKKDILEALPTNVRRIVDDIK